MFPLQARAAEDVDLKVISQIRDEGFNHFQAVEILRYLSQDPLDYGSKLHHTRLDTFDHIAPEDLKQASVIMASFL